MGLKRAQYNIFNPFRLSFVFSRLFFSFVCSKQMIIKTVDDVRYQTVYKKILIVWLTIFFAFASPVYTYNQLCKTEKSVCCDVTFAINFRVNNSGGCRLSGRVLCVRFLSLALSNGLLCVRCLRVIISDALPEYSEEHINHRLKGIFAPQRSTIKLNV